MTSRRYPRHRHLRGRFTAGALSLVAFAVVLTRPVDASAQAAGILPRAAHLPGSTRAMGLGDAYAMTSGHADAVFYHPALLTGASGMGVEVQRWTQNGSAAALSGAVQWLGGGIGVGLRTLQYGALRPGAAAVPAGQDHLFDSGTEPVSERIATLAYAREVVFGIDVGVAVDLVDERFPTDSINGHGVTMFDLGVARDLGPVTLGVTVHDIGTKPVFDSGMEPSRIEVGFGGYGQEVGPLDIGFAAKLGVDNDEVTWGGGIEVGYWPIQGRTFVARLGLQDVPEGSGASPVTAGFAFWGDDVTVEWAFRPFEGADEGGTHRFGLRWR